MQVKLDGWDAAAGTVSWRDPETGEAFETSVTRRRLQAAMEGRLGDALVRARRRLRDVGQGSDRQRAPVGPHLPHPRRRRRRPASPTSCSSTSTRRRSASRKGNGLSVEEWLRYAPPEALGQFMFNAPQRAKRLYFDVIPQRGRRIPRQRREGARQQDAAARLTNPAWHIHGGDVPRRSCAARSRSPCCSTSRAS